MTGSGSTGAFAWDALLFLRGMWTVPGILRPASVRGLLLVCSFSGFFPIFCQQTEKEAWLGPVAQACNPGYCRG